MEIVRTSNQIVFELAFVLGAVFGAVLVAFALAVFGQGLIV